MSAPPARGRPTLADVARTVGVSPGTASKALNGRDDVSAATRERVLAVATQLGYRPDAKPGPGRDRRAAAVVFDLPASPYIVNVLHGVLAAATDAGLDLLTRLAPDRTSRRRRGDARAWVVDQQAAGVVGVVGLTLSEPGRLLDAADDVGLPFVMVDPVDTGHRRMVSVGSSNWAGARAATEHLIALGHRRIAWVGGPDASAAARDRLHGYRAALESAGIEVDADLVRSDLFDVAAGARHARELLRAAAPPTAIMAGDDEIAVGVLGAARELGVPVPAALSVVGFDDTPQAEWTTPPLTTVHQHLEGMGRIAVRTVVAMAAGEHPPARHIEFATTSTERGTTGPRPAPVVPPRS